MQCVVFPKFFQELSTTELARALSGIGFDGVDVMLRDGYWVDAPSVAEKLPQFVTVMHDFGLTTENATTAYLDPNEPYVEAGVACLAENGVRQFRLEHMRYDGIGTYQKDLDAARRKLDAFAVMGERHGIRAFIQTHGGSLHPSASAARRIVEGFDPQYIGVHHDPGNMICQEGYEAWDKGIDILGDYLCMVGVKNAGMFQRPGGATFEMGWTREWTTLAEGAVDYRVVLDALSAVGFDGPLCMHNFYDKGLEALTAQTQRDLDYLQNLLAQSTT
jgi:sugar phosphate isomerase/epimerase